LEAEVSVVCVATSTEEIENSPTLVSKAVEFLASQWITVKGRCREGYPSEHILKLAEEEKSGLIVIPSPYAEKAEKQCIESLGTTVEVVLRRASCPVILVRNLIPAPEEATKAILLPIHSVKAYRAAEWALALAEEGSKSSASKRG